MCLKMDATHPSWAQDKVSSQARGSKLVGVEKKVPFPPLVAMLVTLTSKTFAY